MEKRGILAFLSVLVINFVHAQLFDGGYGSFSITNFINSVDPNTVVYGLLFLILFTLIFLGLTRIGVFKSGRKNQFGVPETNTVAAGVVSFAAAALIVYYLYRSGYNLQQFFYSLGFSGSLGSILLVLLVFVVAALIIIKFKLPAFFIIAGIFLMLTSIFTDLIYEKGIAFIIGLAIFIIGIFIGKKMRNWAGKNWRAT